ncbi:HNH endonuclease signature motif containing protein [Anatilimnocola floriformis]|uniref:HNH endonuclease signature motif containing protein n=1 Tax=Anatilimnocola floriformis TaxID=2948575 RepID=UPI0036F1AA70
MLKVNRIKLANNPLCEDCEEQGITRPASEVHHIVKPNGNPELMYSLNNLKSLCKSCHSKRTQRGE